MQKMLVAITVTFVWLSNSAHAQAPHPDVVTLHVGDSAPDLVPAKWLKGEPVAKFEKGKVYVIEFWATWCPPCRASIPHISKLQDEFKDIIFIGQDWQDDPTEAAEFVHKMGDKMNYRVALDDKDDEKGKMSTLWMAAAGLHQIPTAFVVDKGARIAWIGDPMEMHGVLKDVLAGTFDPKKAAEEEALINAVEEKLDAAMKNHDFDAAIAALDELAKAEPSMADRALATKFKLLLQKQDYAAAWDLGKKLSETCKDKPEVLGSLAWTIVNPDDAVEKPDLDLAEKLASRSVELTKGEDGDDLDTLARVYFAKGSIDKAIETQAQAVAKAADEEKAHFQKSLDEYKAAKDLRHNSRP